VEKPTENDASGVLRPTVHERSERNAIPTLLLKPFCSVLDGNAREGRSQPVSENSEAAVETLAIFRFDPNNKGGASKDNGRKHPGDAHGGSLGDIDRSPKQGAGKGQGGADGAGRDRRRVTTAPLGGTMSFVEARRIL
jgi:hypothetical protein